jgi:hypothetical protein
MKYIEQHNGTYSSYNEKSEEYKALTALPADRRPGFLDENSKKVKDHHAAMSAANADSEEKSLVAEATRELLGELVADKLAERVEQLRTKRKARK